MTFGPDHYVPVIKIKRGEKAALGQISPPLRSRMTPLLEIVARKPEKNLAAHIDTAFTNLARSVLGYPRCFLDVREIEADGPTAAATVFERAANSGMTFTPVTGVSRSADAMAALSHRNRGLAVRLTKLEFENGGLTAKMRSFLEHHQLAANDVDLIVDLGGVDDLIPDGIGALTKAFLADVPHHDRWRTFTVSACAFPVSMGGIERDSHGFVERADWIAWKDNFYRHRDDFTRVPTFSDCAVQHPRDVEGFDPRTMQVSATIRYTTDRNWLLVKGQSTRSIRSGVQFPKLATRLVYGHLKSDFSGSDHCTGCRSMKAAADGEPNYGSAEAWRRLGTIHHISQVIRELGSLPWP